MLTSSSDTIVCFYSSCSHLSPIIPWEMVSISSTTANLVPTFTNLNKKFLFPHLPLLKEKLFICFFFSIVEGYFEFFGYFQVKDFGLQLSEFVFWSFLDWVFLFQSQRILAIL